MFLKKTNTETLSLRYGNIPYIAEPQRGCLIGQKLFP